MRTADERRVTSSGPYFAGRQPAGCGHHYPDVLRLRDEKRQDGTFVRIIDCRYCGQYERQLDEQTLDKELVRKLNQREFDVGRTEAELSEVRQQALERFSARDSNEKSALRKLRSMFEAAINRSAQSIVLEEVGAGLDLDGISASTFSGCHPRGVAVFRLA